MDIHCPHFPLCSGCSIDNSVEHFKTYSEAVSYFKSIGVSEFPLRTGSPVHWRCRAKLAVRGSVEAPLLGLYEKGSHRVVDIPECRVHHPLINKAAALLRTWIHDSGIAPFREIEGAGVLRYLLFGVDRINNSVQLTLVVNLDESEASLFKESLEKLWNLQPGLWHSLWLNFNKRRDNVITGSTWKLFRGDEWLWESYCGKMVATHPASFVQANPVMFERLLEHLDTWVPSGASIAEFYAGGGAIGLTLIDKCTEIVFNEVVPLAEKCFEESSKWLSISQKEKSSFILGAAEKCVDKVLSGATVAIVDPPRKGLDRSLLKAFNNRPELKRLLYVSCGWESFCRDCNLLLSEGWRIEVAEGYLFFPGTDHLEVFVAFEK